MHFRGENDKAYENLRLLNHKQPLTYRMVMMINEEFLFDSIRDEPEFQQIVGIWKPNTKQSMKGSGNGWRRMRCCDLPASLIQAQLPYSWYFRLPNLL